MTGPVSVGRPDAIIFDCDGVVLESVEMKIAAFLDVLPQDPRRLEEVRRYYQEYSGLPRHEQLEHVFGRIYGLPLGPESEAEISRRYGAVIADDYRRCPLVPGARELLEAYSAHCPLFLVSGTPHDELDAVIEAHGLTPCFEGVFGSPTEKATHCAAILREWKLDPARVVMVGDSTADLDAARAVGIPFIGRRREGGTTFADAGVPTVGDLRELKELLDRRNGPEAGTAGSQD